MNLLSLRSPMSTVRLLTISSLLLATMISIGVQHVASGADSPGPMVPEILVRAGTTGDVYALFESATIPGRNVIELSKEGDEHFRPMGSLPLKKGIAADGPAVQELLFANELDGVALAQSVTTKLGTTSPLFVTHDGGATWTTEEISPTTQIRAMASTSNYWY